MIPKFPIPLFPIPKKAVSGQRLAKGTEQQRCWAPPFPKGELFFQCPMPYANMPHSQFLSFPQLI
ncbi:MAG: hypothetical protein F6J93_39575 [Oscillatoria sp. SIO1A7]|nr:hypothetical protein [Oscillatoria sp. SIO1A7]